MLYIILHGKKGTEKKTLESGFFMVWTEKNVKSAFAFGNGTMKDFKRFAADRTKKGRKENGQEHTRRDFENTMQRACNP